MGFSVNNNQKYTSDYVTAQVSDGSAGVYYRKARESQYDFRRRVEGEVATALHNRGSGNYKVEFYAPGVSGEVWNGPNRGAAPKESLAEMQRRSSYASAPAPQPDRYDPNQNNDGYWLACGR